MNTGVVIVTYNRLSLLKECLNCVSNQEIPFSRIVVVDNASSDGTKEYLDSITSGASVNGLGECFKGEFSVIHSMENLGGAGGFYEGLLHLENKDVDWALLIDDDAMLAPGFLKQMAAFAESEAALSCCVKTDGRVDTSHHRRIANRLIFEERPVDEAEYRENFYCDTATFCGFMIRMDVVKEIGLPKKEYFIWCDDTEYCLRLFVRGMRVLVVTEAVLDHKTVLSTDKGSLLMRIETKSYYGYRNRYDAAKEHLGGLTAIVILMEYRIFWIFSYFFTLSKDERRREQGWFNLSLLSDVIHDCKAGRLGKRTGYLD